MFLIFLLRRFNILFFLISLLQRSRWGWCIHLIFTIDVCRRVKRFLWSWMTFIWCLLWTCNLRSAQLRFFKMLQISKMNLDHTCSRMESAHHRCVGHVTFKPASIESYKLVHSTDVFSWFWWEPQRCVLLPIVQLCRRHGWAQVRPGIGIDLVSRCFHISAISLHSSCINLWFWVLASQPCLFMLDWIWARSRLWNELLTLVQGILFGVDGLCDWAAVLLLRLEVHLPVVVGAWSTVLPVAAGFGTCS